MHYSSPDIQAISDFVVNSFGIQFPPNRENELMRAVGNTAQMFGCSQNSDEIKHWLCDRHLSENDLRELSEQLTINETYFFREKTALELLSSSIIPSIMEKRDINKHPIRIWSAGCSSGEEAYSIAMWLSEAFKEIKPENLQIIATDISPKAVAKALKSEYSEWSFRETGSELKKKYFNKKDRHYHLKPEIQKYVTFSFLNLAKNCFPSSLTNTENMDVIFCRNVLMYFRPDKIKEVSDRFYKALNNDGWLITSQVELNDDYFGIFRRVHFKNGIYYCKNARLNKVTNEIQTQRKIEIRIKSAKSKPEKKKSGNLFDYQNIKLSIPKPKQEVIDASMPKSDELESVKKICNTGNFEAAIAKIKDLLATHKENADLYYLYANILYEKNEPLDAEKYLIKTLYLNQYHLDAIMLLAYMLKQRKMYSQSMIYFKQAVELLDNKCQTQECDPELIGLKNMINNELLSIRVV